MIFSFVFFFHFIGRMLHDYYFSLIIICWLSWLSFFFVFPTQFSPWYISLNDHLKFLHRFLIPIALPIEAQAAPVVAGLQEEYKVLMDEFKEAHKQYQKSLKENSQLRELRGDIDIIEMEKENGRV